MSSQIESQIESTLSLIKEALLDVDSPMYLKNIRRMEVTANGTVLLNPNNKEDKEWYDED